MRVRPLVLLTAVLTCGISGAIAESLSGTITNKTVNKPAAGDDVVLIRLAQGMQEAARTKTDARGHYTLDVPDAGFHLVRVTHEKANYFGPVQPGSKTVDIDVFNVAAKVEGVAAEADVMRLQTDESGKSLRVVENFFVKNESSPPKTQFSDRPFEFYLPGGAVVEGSAELSPGGMPVQASPVPLGDANHYAFIFPVRPGETRFQVSYRLPYSGSQQLAPKPVMTTDTIAIMMPKSMSFKAGQTAPYTAISDEVNAQTYVARNVSPSEPLSFTVSGTGQMPRDTAAATAGAPGGPQPGVGDAAGQAGGAASADTRPGGGLGNPVDPGATNDPWAKYRWWIIGGLGLLLAAGAGVMLKRPVGGVSGPAQDSDARGSAFGPSGGGGAVSGTMAALRDELFTLETERLQGSISEAEYAEHKAALERVLRRALGRSGPVASGASASGPVASGASASRSETGSETLLGG